jgi:hypothetical protein
MIEGKTMTYQFKVLEAGAHWNVIKGDFPTRAKATAFAEGWFQGCGYTILCVDGCEHESTDYIDYMVARDDRIYQYAVERQHE